MQPSLVRRMVGAAALLLTSLAASEAAAQAYTIRGSVVDATTQRPLPNVTVMLRGTSARALTSAGGQFGANTGSYLQNMGNARASGYAAAGQARSDALNGVGSAFGDLWGQSQQNRNNPGWT